MSAEPFTVKHYSADQRPTLKGNGFDGLELGEGREEAEVFVQWVNRRIHESEVFRAERDHARQQYQNAARLLTGIHALLWPAPIKTPDGRTMVFRPTGIDLNEVLQELSDRIRAVPDALAKIDAAPTGKTCRADGRCQYAIDHGAEGLGACLPGKCVMAQGGKA